MGYYEESAVIKTSPEKAYETCKDVIAFLERVPGYNITVLEQDPRKVLFKVSARYLLNLKYTWHTLAITDKPLEIQFKQLKGPLKGLRAKWEFAPAPEGTKVTISHDFVARMYGIFKPPLLDKPLEKWLYGYSIENVAQGILKDMKARLEA